MAETDKTGEPQKTTLNVRNPKPKPQSEFNDPTGGWPRTRPEGVTRQVPGAHSDGPSC